MLTSDKIIHQGLDHIINGGFFIKVKMFFKISSFKDESFVNIGQHFVFYLHFFLLDALMD